VEWMTFGHALECLYYDNEKGIVERALGMFKS